jgi:NifB/MoaA-like Fe-S oxidoreductase
MVRSFREEFARMLRRLERRPAPVARLNATVLTGKLFAPVLAPLVEQLNARFGTRLRTVAVENDYFGPDIVVAGLVTGRDVLAARASVEGDFVVAPSSMFKSDEPVMLDGMTLGELEAELGLPVRVVDFDGFANLLGV